jgi:Kef-type K+ transport system membrane component KefB
MVTFPPLKSKNAPHKEYAQCSIGALILEDILSIFVLVVLPIIASHGYFDTDQIKNISLLIGVFVVVVFFFCKFLAPFLVKALFRSSSKEVLVVTAIGFSIAICLLSKNFNLSPTLEHFYPVRYYLKLIYLRKLTSLPRH